MSNPAHGIYAAIAERMTKGDRPVNVDAIHYFAAPELATDAFGADTAPTTPVVVFLPLGQSAEADSHCRTTREQFQISVYAATYAAAAETLAAVGAWMERAGAWEKVSSGLWQVSEPESVVRAMDSAWTHHHFGTWNAMTDTARVDRADLLGA